MQSQMFKEIKAVVAKGKKVPKPAEVKKGGIASKLGAKATSV